MFKTLRLEQDQHRGRAELDEELVANEDDPREAGKRSRVEELDPEETVALLLDVAGDQLPGSNRGHEPADADLAARASMPDPELAIAKKRSHEAFSAAFEAAMSTLTLQQRTLLRLHYLDGLSNGSIAEMERVSSATVRRWIDAARRELFAATRRFLAERFHFSTAAVDLVWGDLGSDVDLSVSRLLRSQLATS